MNLRSYLPPGWDTGDLVVAFAGVAVFVAVTAVWTAFVDRDPMAARARQLAAKRQVLHDELAGPRRRTQNVAAIGFMRGVIHRFDLLKSGQADQAAIKLSRAGIRSKDAVVVYLFAKLCLPLLLAAALGAWMFAVSGDDEMRPVQLVMPLGVVLAGMLAPDIYIKNAILKRRKALLLGIPDTLDLLVICVEAGLSLDAALNRVASELGHSYPELADELSLTALELGFQPDRRTALENLMTRTDMPQIRSVVNTLLQSEKFGTPLAQSLRVLADEYRNERMLRAEEKAARLPAVLTVPMILFILPALFVVILVPAILRTIDSMSGVRL